MLIEILAWLSNIHWEVEHNRQIKAAFITPQKLQVGKLVLGGNTTYILQGPYSYEELSLHEIKGIALSFERSTAYIQFKEGE